MGGGACRDDCKADDESDEGQSVATAWRHQSCMSLLVLEVAGIHSGVR
jgi:hypothetical protein